MGFFVWLLWPMSGFVEIGVERVFFVWLLWPAYRFGCCLVSGFGGGMVAGFLCLWLWQWCLVGFFAVVLWVLWVQVMVGFLW